MLYIYTDVIHPESGEVLAEDDDVLNEETPHAKHVLAIAEEYDDHYLMYIDGNGDTWIYDQVAS